MMKSSDISKNLDLRNSNQKGSVSLPELLIVILLILIMATIALLQFGTSKDQFRRQNIAQQLKVAFERSRFDSVKRRAVSPHLAKVTVNAAAFTLTTDINNNDTIESADDSLQTFGNQNVSITYTTGNTMTFPVTVTFNKRGEVIATDAVGNVVNPIFLVCNATCNSNTATTSNSSIVLVTPTGTVNLLAGNAAIPTFATPAVTPVPVGANIKTTVTLP